jgi:hypothetical protein
VESLSLHNREAEYLALRRTSKLFNWTLQQNAEGDLLFIQATLTALQGVGK